MAIQPATGAINNINIRSVSTAPTHRVGQRTGKDTLRREWVYVSMATTADVGTGKLVAADFSITSTVDIDNSCLNGAAIGATSLTITSATIGSATANQYAGCVLGVTDDAGEGYAYEILSNTAASSNAVTFTLAEGLAVAVTSASDFVIGGGPYAQLTIFDATGGSDEVVAGATVCAWTPNAASAMQFGWIQISGPAMVLCDPSSAIAVGDWLTVSDGVDGACQEADAHSEMHIGQAMQAGTNGAYVMVNLSID